MEFFLENVLRRLRAGRKMYVLLFLEMAIGSLVLSISLNLMFTGEKQRREYEKQNAEYGTKNRDYRDDECTVCEVSGWRRYV
mgnify:CR=1 FL=1